MLLHEAMGSSFRERVKIYATDIDEDALNHARPPSYTERETRGQPESYRAGLRITGSPRVGLAGQQFPATPGYHPAAYLRGVRMECAHRDLQGAEPGDASAWQHLLLSGASPILVVSPLITGADSARIRARRYVAELCSRAVSVGSRPVEMSRCATSPILLW